MYTCTLPRELIWLFQAHLKRNAAQESLVGVPRVAHRLGRRSLVYELEDAVAHAKLPLPAGGPVHLAHPAAVEEGAYQKVGTAQERANVS